MRAVLGRNLLLLTSILDDCTGTACRVWDCETGREKSKLEGHSNKVSSVAISSDGRTVISGAWDASIR